MELPPELEKSIKTALSLVMDEQEAERFMNFDYATSLVKQGQPPWQALFSVGVYAAELYVHQDMDVEKASLQEIVSEALKPVETLFESILHKSGEKLLEGEQARLLFHTRFALGFLVLAGGSKERSKAILHDMAATKVSIRGRSYYGEGAGILGCTDDIGQGKLQTAISLLPEYANQKNFGEILYLMTEALACAPWATPIRIIVPRIIDSCVAACEKEDYDGPGLEWLWLFVEVGELLSLYEEYDSSGSEPNECKVESAQYLSWKIGQIAGRFAVRWHDDPFGEFKNFEDAIGEKECQSERGEEETQQAVMVILALLREYDPSRDWQKMRDQCLSMWRLSYSYSGMPLSEIGPCHDLYWAMRIGFADALLKHLVPLLGTNEIDGAIGQKMRRQIEDILRAKERLSTEEVRKLVDSEESVALEFKASARWDYKEKRLNNSLCLPVMKTVAAFLNGGSGRLLIGVGDDHKILGLSYDYQGFRKERDQYKRFIVDKLCVHVGIVECSQAVLIEFYSIDNKDICLLDVGRSANPVYVREGDAADFYIRVENTTRKLNTREAHDYIGLNFPRRSS